MATIEKYIGESKVREAPSKKLTLKIGEGVIKPKHLSEEVITEVIQPVIEDVVDSMVHGTSGITCYVRGETLVITTEK